VSRIVEVVSTNTVPPPADFPGLTVLSVAALFADAIDRIHNGRSVSKLFNDVDPAYAPPPEPEGLF
jgi:ribose-phosphate pyrophosphokinase